MTPKERHVQREKNRRLLHQKNQQAAPTKPPIGLIGSVVKPAGIYQEAFTRRSYHLLIGDNITVTKS